MGSKSKPVPSKHFSLKEDESSLLKTPAIELNHVREVYDRVASQWAGTRYKAWPEVERFLRDHASTNDLVMEVGCGNGKNLPDALNATKSPIVLGGFVLLFSFVIFENGFG
jgi:hypothetical protein